MSILKKTFYAVLVLVILIALYIFIPFKEIFREKPTFAYKKDSKLKSEIATFKPVPYPQVKFATLSDTHIYDTSLGSSGAAFQDYLDNDRKMLVQSSEILDSALKDIIEQKPVFVVVSGDLTKDGEVITHELFARKIALLKENGIKVYVVPGNHDINNSHSVRFIGDKKEPVPSVNDTQFREIYNDFGFDEAIDKDPDSLSYIVEPVPGLWLFALDSVKWRENTPKIDPIVEGRFYPKELAWIESKLAEANRQGKAILVTQHHGALEHYKGNKDYYPEYLIDDFELISEMFAFYNARVVLTGHFHSNDISMRKFGEKIIYDIETGSLVTAPSPYRFISLDGHKVAVQSKVIQSIESIQDFQPFAHEYTKQGLEVLAKSLMGGYGVSSSDQEYIAPFISRAFLAHYAGDEKPSGELLPDSSRLGVLGKVVLMVKKDLVIGVWNDLKPEDNNLVIDLESR